MNRINLLFAAFMTAMFSMNSGCSRNSNIVHQDVEITESNGTILRGYIEGPEKSLINGKKCPAIILFHGLMDYNEFSIIRKQADAYTKKGYAVVAFDFDGHGKSDGKLIDMTISKELADGQAILNYVRKLPFVSEITICGHSQGGVIASITAARNSNKVSNLVLLAPGGMIADRFRNGICFGTKFDPSNPPEKVMVFDDYVGRDYIVDAMAMDLYKMAEGFSGHKVLLIAGENDSLVSPEIVQKYEKIYSKPEYKNTVLLKMASGAPHDFAGHEKEVTSTVLNFLHGPGF